MDFPQPGYLRVTQASSSPQHLHVVRKRSVQRNVVGFGIKGVILANSLHLS